MIQVIKLPENLRRTLERTVNKLKTRDDVYGVGLFGSWSRGEATESSDVDLFVLVKGISDHEYVERFERSGFFIDLCNVPRKLFLGIIPPELDQKLNELQILYDRDWSLTNTKLLMTKCYDSPERIAIRTERHVVNSDIYLSRATSAFSRCDYRSACLFSVKGAEAALNVLAEIALVSFSNSHAIERLDGAAATMNMHGLFDQFLVLSGLERIDENVMDTKLKLFKAAWDDMNALMMRNEEKLEKCHFNIRAILHYYLNPVFLKGALVRIRFMIASGKYVEAQHYLKSMFLDALENYVPFRGMIENVRADCATPMHSVESFAQMCPRERDPIADLLDVTGVEKAEAAEMIRKSREIILAVRKQRKVLIKNRLIKGWPALDA